MFCPKCGTQNPDGARFCGNCGNNLQQAAACQAPVPGPVPASVTAPVVSGQMSPASGAQVPPAGLDPAQPKRSSSKSAVVGIIVAAGILVLAVAALLFFTPRGARGNGSPEDMAENLTTSLQRVFDEDLDASATTDYMNEALDMTHPGVVDGMMRYEGITSREELGEQVTGMTNALTAFSGLFDYIDADVTVRAANPLDSDDLADINSRLSSIGLDLTVTEGYEFEMDMTMTFTQELYGVPAGTSESDVADAGLSAVNIDGGWYLWVDGWSD